MISKKQAVNILMGLIGLSLMQKGFSEAQGKALTEKPVGWSIALAIFGLLIALIAAARYLYERNKNNQYSPTEILSKAYRNRTTSKATLAYPEDYTTGQIKDSKSESAIRSKEK